ncbi:MAG: SDR family oxidoreductase [Nevskiaceae bacterium]|nr:MAG: SDR family oxidoreductase [Nevskiaceae bacterium]
MPTPSFAHQKCFVTGAASGIGRATAQALAAEGAELFLTDINATGLAAVVEGIRSEGGTVTMSRALDIADHAAVRAYADDIHREHGAMDAVFNIAGISVWGTVHNLGHDHWRRAVEINLMGPIHVIECLVPPMVESGRGGRLANVSSAAGLFGLPWHAAYSASKFGLRGVSEVLRFDLRRYGIKVSLICPGGVDTGLVQTLEIPGIDTQHPKVQALRARFRRHAVTPERAAAAILRGVRRGDYLVFTSPDIRIGYWFQCKLPLFYELAMRFLNGRLYALAEKAGAQVAGPGAQP